MKLRIAYSFEIFLPSVSGVITATANLAENLIRKGHEIYCIIPAWRKSPSSLLRIGAPAVPVPSIPSYIYPGLRLSLPWSRVPERFMREQHIDILHVTAPGTIARSSMRAAHKLNIPVVHTWHTMLSNTLYLKHLLPFNLLIPLVQRFSWRYYRPYIYGSDVITAPSSETRQLLEKHYSGTDIRTISNGLDIAAFRKHGTLKDLQKMLPRFDKRSFLFFGRVSQEKSIDVLIHALAVAQQRIPEIQLFIVGEGPAVEPLRALTIQLGIEKNVHLVGPMSHELLRSSGIIHYARASISASETETQGLTFIESLCSGTPAIAIDSDNTRNIIGPAGLFFPAGDVGALAESIIQIATDNALHTKLSAATAGQVERYDGLHISNTFLDLYYEILNKK